MSRNKPLIAAVAVLASIALAAGTADAKRGGGPKPKPTATSATTSTTSEALVDVAHSGQRLGNHPKHTRSFKLAVNESLVASTIGVSLDVLRTELHTGLSVAQVATNRGVAPATITAALTADMTTQINVALSSGKITQTRATQLLGDLPVTIANYMNRIHYVRPLPTTTTTVAPTTTTAAPTTTVVSG